MVTQTYKKLMRQMEIIEEAARKFAEQENITVYLDEEYPGRGAWTAVEEECDEMIQTYRDRGLREKWDAVLNKLQKKLWGASR